MSNNLFRDDHLCGLSLSLMYLQVMVQLLGFLFSICSCEKEVNSLGEYTTVGHLSTENKSNFSKLMTE